MRWLFLSTLVMMLSGCATKDWYAAAPGVATAKLRAIADAPGNSYMTVAVSRSCPKSAFGSITREGDKPLGNFHSDALSIQGASRGFDRKLGMPGSEQWPNNLFSEHNIEAGRPLFVRATSTFSRGSPYDVGFCHAIGQIELEAGGNYELQFLGNGPSCKFQLMKLVQTSEPQVLREPVPFVSGPGNCQFGD